MNRPQVEPDVVLYELVEWATYRSFLGLGGR
jgi:hypothetical protein